MTTGIWSAASGAVARMHSLDIAADNIANANTPGYRAEIAAFRQALVEATPANEATQAQRFGLARSVARDFRMGPIEQTGRKLDVAITDAQGLFAVQTPEGERYTRAGSFRVDVEGRIMTAEGFPVLGADRRPIQVTPGGEPGIESDGTLTVNGEPAGGQLRIVRFQNPSALERAGQTLLVATPQSGRPIVHEVGLEPESLELSNASAVESMTGVLSASREFELIGRVIEAFSAIDQRAASDLMRR